MYNVHIHAYTSCQWHIQDLKKGSAKPSAWINLPMLQNIDHAPLINVFLADKEGCFRSNDDEKYCSGSEL